MSRGSAEAGAIGALSARWSAGPVLVRTPATSATLGPGFDALGLALRLHDEVRAEVIGGGLRIEVSGAGEMTARFGEGHLVVRAMRAAFDALGEQPPGIRLSCVNAIPHGFGLGSSAAAIVAGVLAARALFGGEGRERLPDEAVLGLATGLEGHADNVAACLAGGLTIAWDSADGGAQPEAGRSVRSVRLEPLPQLTPVLCVPVVPLATEAARRGPPPAPPPAPAPENPARPAPPGAPRAPPGLVPDAA